MKLFVWDFHGVLEKGNDQVVLEITNTALKRHGYSRQMTENENEFLCGSRWHEYFAFLLPGLEAEEYFKLQSTCFEISQNQWEITAQHIRLNDHAESVLDKIHHSPHCQILISNTVPQALDMFIKIVNIDRYFPPSHRFGVNMHPQTKATKQDSLNQFLKDCEPFDTIISIGDSAGDMTLINQYSERKGIGYLYTHPEKQHRQAVCHYKINDLRVILREISSENLM